jgi:hypothetical protein
VLLVVEEDLAPGPRLFVTAGAAGAAQIQVVVLRKGALKLVIRLH